MVPSLPSCGRRSGGLSKRTAAGDVARDFSFGADGSFTVLQFTDTHHITADPRSQRALDAAYYTSAYYEYYRDELFEIMDRRAALLWDWNLSLIRFLLDKTGIACTLVATESFEVPGTVPDDYRYDIHPKRPNTVLRDLGLEKPYYQVFSDRFGFTPGLSALDLLFNEGPDALLWLKRVFG